jgi:hypothetical protein
MSINAGRFSKFSWAVTSNPTLASTTSAPTDVTLSDTLFVYPTGKKYTLTPANLMVEVQVGVPCVGSAAGQYVVFFGLTNTVNFYNLPPVQATVVTNAAKGVIVFAFDQGAVSTIPGGVLPGTYTLTTTDVNVDDIVGVWKGDAKNDATSKLTFPTLKQGATLVAAMFSVDNVDATLTQSFTLDALVNTCFQVDRTTVTVAISGESPSLAANVVTSGWFVYQNPETEPKIISANPTRLSSLLWVMTPTMFPLNVFCALVCKTAPALVTADVRGTGTLVLGVLARITTMYVTSTRAVDLFFDGLVRGNSYSLTCIVETTESLASARKVQNFTQNSLPSGNTTVDFTPNKVDSTICLTFVFSKLPSDALKKFILGYCQNAFTAGAARPITTGCVTCVDDAGLTVAGSALPTDVTCPSAARRLRNLQADPVVVPVVVPSFTYNICAVPSVICATNVVSTRRLRNLADSPGLRTVIEGTVRENLKDEAAFANLNYPNTGVTAVNVVSDTVAPVIVWTTGATSNDNTGKYSVVINYNATTTFDCYYQVLSGTAAPTAASLKACTSAGNCGKFVVQAPSVTVAGTTNPAYQIGNSYTLWAACYNRVPGAQLASAVKNVYTFTPACPTGQQVTGGVCTAPAPVTPVPTSNTTTSSNFVFISLASIVAMVFLLLN